MSKVKTIKAESGISFEFHKTWYKLSYAEEWELEGNENLLEEHKKLWDKVNSVVDSQMQEIIEGD